jgi:hypothetical protein
VSEVDETVMDTSDWWACTDWPYLVEPSRVERLIPEHRENLGWVLRADAIGNLSVTLVGAYPARAAAERAALDLGIPVS